MTKDMLTASPEDPVVNTIKQMFLKRVSGVPVVGSRGELVGIISDTDILRPDEPKTFVTENRKNLKSFEWSFLFGNGVEHAADFLRQRKELVRDLMTVDVKTISPGASLETCAQKMTRHRLKRLVVQEHNIPAGIISRSDLFQALASHMFATEKTF